MASRVLAVVNKARAAVEPSACAVRREVVKYYEGTMAKNAEYVVKDPAAADKLLKQYTYTQLSRIPSGIEACKTEAAAFRNRLGEWREIPVTEAAIYAGFAAEVFAWFCVGEIIGRGFSLSGYSI